MMHTFTTINRDQSSRRRKWSEAEDATLIELVGRFGLDNWRVVGQHMGQRDAKQCRERYLNHLDPSVKKGKLTLKEWKSLIEAHERLGNKWSDIAAIIPGRTPNTLKNFWHSNLRTLAIKELYGTQTYHQGLRPTHFHSDDLEVEFMADERPASPDRMEVEDEESSVSSSTVSPMQAFTSSPVPTFHTSFGQPMMAPAPVYAPAPMVLEDKKALATFASAGPLPHIWDALVETAMVEYQREKQPLPSQPLPSFGGFPQQQVFMAPNNNMAPFYMQPSQQMPTGFPSYGAPNGFGFDSGKGSQFWSH